MSGHAEVPTCNHTERGNDTIITAGCIIIHVSTVCAELPIKVIFQAGEEQSIGGHPVGAGPMLLIIQSLGLFRILDQPAAKDYLQKQIIVRLKQMDHSQPRQIRESSILLNHRGDGVSPAFRSKAKCNR